jgi:hypothetical protein
MSPLYIAFPSDLPWRFSTHSSICTVIATYPQASLMVNNTHIVVQPGYREGGEVTAHKKSYFPLVLCIPRDITDAQRYTATTIILTFSTIMRYMSISMTATKQASETVNVAWQAVYLTTFFQ